jgi:ATP-binding cassette, subfamily B, bacterial PglK
LTLVILLTSMVVKALSTLLTYRFALRCEGKLSQALFRYYLFVDYVDLVRLDRSRIERQVLSEATIVANNGVLPVINIFSQGIVVLLIISVLLWVDVTLAIISAGLLSSTYFIIYRRNSRILSAVGKNRIRANDERFKIVAESFTNIRDLKLRGCEDVSHASYVERSSDYVRYQATSSILAALPRFIVEGLAFGGMIGISLYLLVTTSGASEIFPLISLYAIAGYRLMPALQMIYSSASQLRFINTATDELSGPVFSNKITRPESASTAEPIAFEAKIEVGIEQFRYHSNGPKVLEKVALSIDKYQMVGIVGSSGSGKSTLMDILSGLLPIEHGGLKVDDLVINNETVREWQKKIGYVSQDVVLMDDTILNNVVGADAEFLDYKWLEEVAELAGLTEILDRELSKGWGTKVGERGGRLSGGQRQRVAIARALYRRPALLLLDEATSALDNQSEKMILQTLVKLKGHVTVVFVSHRENTLSSCDIVYRISGGVLSSDAA